MNTDPSHASHDHIYRHENMPFDIDVWYPIFNSITFPSYFFPLEYEDARAIVAYYHSQILHRETLNFDHVQTLQNLERKITSFINSHGNLKNGAFIRLCGRSPKDGDVFHPIQIFDEYKKNLNDLVSQGMDPLDGNTKVNAISKTHWLKVMNGNEALSLLLTSERVYFDLNDWMRYGGKEQICFREWDKNLSYDEEYRAFVYNNKLTAITQYDHYGKYDHVIQEKNVVEKMINDYWNEKVKPLMKVSDYIIDFGHVNNEIVMIELSPFRECTGCSCYRWARDGEILRHGDGKLRVMETTYPGVDELASMWESQWQTMVDYRQCFENVKETWSHMFQRYLSYIWNTSSIHRTNIFVVSVLKKGFWWNEKYLKNNDFKGKGSVNGYQIGIDQDGMGWIISNGQMRGEIYSVTDDELRDIEYFYGFCKKAQVTVTQENGDVLENVTCFINESLNESNCVKLVQEYLPEMQNDYNSINHQIHLQEKYLGFPFKF